MKAAPRFPAASIPVGDIEEDVLAPALEKAKERVAAGDRKLMFRLNSFGGGVFHGLDFIAAIEDLKKANGVHVLCVVDTRAYSMAAVILQSGMCDERLMTGRSTLLFHNASSVFRGTADDVRKELPFIDALNLSMAVLISDRIGMPLADYQAKIATADWVMGAEEALRLHMIDELVDASVLPPAYVLAAVEPDILKLLQGL